ncbi:hypothetical protein [Bradyrhizobium sp. 195]|nr:hypothetical protein [Bradyrhizobium sp. 195]UPK25353.1 hypothetical protein IVB26_29075 [Bradyrhizobium sp. 195]
MRQRRDLPSHAAFAADSALRSVIYLLGQKVARLIECSRRGATANECVI